MRLTPIERHADLAWHHERQLARHNPTSMVSSPTRLIPRRDWAHLRTRMPRGPRPTLIQKLKDLLA